MLGHEIMKEPILLDDLRLLVNFSQVHILVLRLNEATSNFPECFLNVSQFILTLICTALRLFFQLVPIMLIECFLYIKLRQFEVEFVDGASRCRGFDLLSREIFLTHESLEILFNFLKHLRIAIQPRRLNDLVGGILNYIRGIGYFLNRFIGLKVQLMFLF